MGDVNGSGYSFGILPDGGGRMLSLDVPPIRK